MAEHQCTSLIRECGKSEVFWLGKQLAAFAASVIELAIPKADAVHPQEALAVLPIFCNTDNDLNNCVAGDLTNGRVCSGRQVARAVASIGRMQVASYEVACSHKLVKYWLAGRKLFTALGTVAISTDQSRVGQNNIFKAFIVGVRDGQTKAMWMIPRAISHVKQNTHTIHIYIYSDVWCVYCTNVCCRLGSYLAVSPVLLFSKVIGFHRFYFWVLMGVHGFSWVFMGSHGFSWLSFQRFLILWKWHFPVCHIHCVCVICDYISLCMVF